MNLDSHQRGFTIIEVALALAITGILVLATGQMLVTLQDNLLKNQTFSQRVLSLYRLTDIVTDEYTIRESLELPIENEKLKACIRGGPVGSCATNCCPGNSPEEFAVLETSNLAAPLGQRRRLVGTKGNPAFYTLQGDLCDPEKSTCTYKVTGTFTARCPTNLTACDKAELLIFNLHVQPVSTELNLRDRALTLHYTPRTNARPFINTISDQSITMGQSAKIPIYPNAGHPQEKQNFIFAACESSDPEVAEITCYGFVNEVGQATVKAKTVGTVQMKLQINDTAQENNLSEVSSFQLTVSP